MPAIWKPCMTEIYLHFTMRVFTYLLRKSGGDLANGQMLGFAAFGQRFSGALQRVQLRVRDAQRLFVALRRLNHSLDFGDAFVPHLPELKNMHNSFLPTFLMRALRIIFKRIVLVSL